jgi:hypothetical protein
MKALFVTEITVTDPVTKLPVELGIYRLENGAMVGLDSSVLADLNQPIFNPYDNGVEIDEEDL